MDLGHLPELVPHFFAVAANLTHTLQHQSFETTINIYTALHEHDAMSDGVRNFQMMKFAGSTIGLGISLWNHSIEGSTAFAIADCEALMELERAGRQWRVAHPCPPPTRHVI